MFDASPAYAGKRGTAVYRTFVEITPTTHGRLQFGAIGLWARVFVDGQPIGECNLPYSGFTLDVPPSDAALREVIVVIDNRFNKKRIPLFEQFFDFYAYGGIYRSVQWHEVPEVCIDRVQIRTLEALSGRVLVRVLLRGVAAVSYAFDGAEPVPADGLEFEATVPSPRVWSPGTPATHELRVIIDGDDIIERFGLRIVSTADGQILLNDEPTKLLGYCRHESHPQFGPALPLQQLIDDLQRLRDLGCNFIRGSHYP